MEDVYIGGEAQRLCPPSGCRVAIDTGTSLFTGPCDRSEGSRRRCSSGSGGTSCDLSALPTISFAVGGRRVNSSRQTTCCILVWMRIVRMASRRRRRCHQRFAQQQGSSSFADVGGAEELLPSDSYNAANARSHSCRSRCRRRVGRCGSLATSSYESTRPSLIAMETASALRRACTTRAGRRRPAGCTLRRMMLCRRQGVGGRGRGRMCWGLSRCCRLNF